MPYGFIAETEKSFADQNGGAMDPVDCTGANTIFVIVITAGTETVTDDNANTYVQLVQYGGLAIWIAESVTPANDLVISVTGTDIFAAAIALCFSGGKASGAADETAGLVAAPGPPVSPGSITPTEDNALVIAAVSMANPGADITVDSDFTPSPVYTIDKFGQYLGVAYKIQTTAEAENPEFDWLNVAGTDVGIHSFLAAASGGGSGAGSILLLGVGG